MPDFISEADFQIVAVAGSQVAGFQIVAIVGSQSVRFLISQQPNDGFLEMAFQKTLYQKVLSVNGRAFFTSKIFKKMKNAVLIFLTLFLGLAACQNTQPKTEAKPETTAAPTAEPAASATAAPEAVFACPMHPEVTGKAGDKCPKCKMDLEEKKAPVEAVYACPMHPEVTGKKGDKCPKCKMDLTEKK